MKTFFERRQFFFLLLSTSANHKATSGELTLFTVQLMSVLARSGEVKKKLKKIKVQTFRRTIAVRLSVDRDDISSGDGPTVRSC